MTERTLVVMPMKPFAVAKTRLSAALSPTQRERLVRALFFRTQRFFATQFRGFDRLVVTPCSGVRVACDRAGATCLLEPGLDGLNAAAQRARVWATEQKYARMLLIPGDVPVWIRAEVNQLLDAAQQHDVAIARARDGGTNAMLMRLPSAMAFCYGLQSAKRHADAAVAAGQTTVTCRLPFLAHDLDVPSDCLVLTAELRGLRTSS